MPDQAPEQSVESRLTSFFSADAGQPAEQPEAAPEQEASASEESVAPEDAPEQTDQAGEQPESDGFEEVDLDGETYRVPPKLKEAMLRQQDYTQKTQQVAETARQIQFQREQMNLHAQFAQATAQDQQQLQQVEAQIAQYRQLDWANMDTDTMTRARYQLDTLKEQADGIRNALGAKVQQFQTVQKQMRDQQLRQGMEVLRKSIPKFDNDTVAALQRQASNEGYTAPELEAVTDPRFVRLLWKAQQYDTLKAGQKSAVEAAKKAPPVIKPGASQGQGQVAANQYKALRERLRKTGKVEDAARLFMK